MDEALEEFPLEVIEQEQCVFPPEAEKALGEGIKQLISKKSVGKFKEFAEGLIEVWGSPLEIARSMKSTYDAAPQGSMTRARILDRITSFIQALAEDETEEEFDDETVIAVMKPVLAEAMKRDGWTTGQPQPTEIQLSGSERAALPSHSDSPGDSGSGEGEPEESWTD